MAKHADAADMAMSHAPTRRPEDLDVVLVKPWSRLDSATWWTKHEPQDID